VVRYAKDAQEVSAPTGERFVVSWACPRSVALAYGSGKWGIQVMRRFGRLGMSVVDLRQVRSRSEGEAAIRDVVASIRAGTWVPQSGTTGHVRAVTELPSWAQVSSVVLVGVGGFVALLSDGLTAAIGAAVLCGVVVGLRLMQRSAARRTHPPRRPGVL